MILAKDIAIKLHGEQTYGNLPYAAHLQAVVSIVASPGGVPQDFIDAAWLHDVIEDTMPSLPQIVKKTMLAALFNEAVAELIYACSGEGVNRRARNAVIYARIAACPPARWIKMADRIANVESCVLQCSTELGLMYLREAPEFYDHVATHMPHILKERLRTAYQEVDAMIAQKETTPHGQQTQPETEGV